MLGYFIISLIVTVDTLCPLCKDTAISRMYSYDLNSPLVLKEAFIALTHVLFPCDKVSHKCKDSRACINRCLNMGFKTAVSLTSCHCLCQGHGKRTQDILDRTP